MATSKQLQKLQSKIDQGKGKKYASELGISKKQFNSMSSSGSSSGSMSSSKGDSTGWDSENGSWKSYDFGKKLQKSELNEIIDAYRSRGFSEIGANNVALKAGARYQQSGGVIGSSAMNMLENLNQGYFTDSGNVGRGGTVGGGGANFWNGNFANVQLASQGKKGNTAFRWTPGTASSGQLQGGRASWKVGGFTQYSTTDTGKRNAGDLVGTWDPKRSWRYEGEIDPYKPSKGGKKGGGSSAPPGGRTKAGRSGTSTTRGSDFDMPSVEGGENTGPDVQGGAGTLAGANAAGIRTRRSRRYRSGLTMRGTQQLNRMLINATGLNV